MQSGTATVEASLAIPHGASRSQVLTQMTWKFVSTTKMNAHEYLEQLYSQSPTSGNKQGILK